LCYNDSIMGTIELRSKLLDFIANADEKYLKRISDFLERSNQEESYIVSDEHKMILDQRLKNHKANPTLGRDWNELKSELSSKYGL